MEALLAAVTRACSIGARTRSPLPAPVRLWLAACLAASAGAGPLAHAADLPAAISAATAVSTSPAAIDSAAGRPARRAIPSAETLADVREAAGRHVIRFTTAAGTWIIPRAAFDSSGVRALAPVRQPARSAVVQFGSPPPPPPLPPVVAWSEIKRIEVGRSQWRRGAAGGAFLWTLAAIAYYPVAIWLLTSTPDYPAGAPLLLGSFVGLTGGGAALTASSKEWTVVWEPPGAEPWIREKSRKR